MNQRFPLLWPASKARTPREQRKEAQFGVVRKDEKNGWKNRKKLSVAEACERVLDELSGYTRVGHKFRVHPDSIVISTNLKYKQDGLPYSNQKEPEDTGVAVYFTLDGKPYCLPCDKWTRIADNLAAIAAHIAANRGIERWGVGESGDLYAGYAALPAPGQSTVISCWEILGMEGTKDNEMINAQFRAQARRVHSDLGGNDADMARLNEARKQALQYANS